MITAFIVLIAITPVVTTFLFTAIGLLGTLLLPGKRKEREPPGFWTRLFRTVKYENEVPARAPHPPGHPPGCARGCDMSIQ